MFVCSSVKHLDAVAAIGATGMIDPEKLAKWVAEARLDPNDPANANLLYLMKVRISIHGLRIYM